MHESRVYFDWVMHLGTGTCRYIWILVGSRKWFFYEKYKYLSNIYEDADCLPAKTLMKIKKYVAYVVKK